MYSAKSLAQVVRWKGQNNEYRIFICCEIDCSDELCFLSGCGFSVGYISIVSIFWISRWYFHSCLEVSRSPVWNSLKKAYFKIKWSKYIFVTFLLPVIANGERFLYSFLVDAESKRLQVSEDSSHFCILAKICWTFQDSENLCSVFK